VDTHLATRPVLMTDFTHRYSWAWVFLPLIQLENNNYCHGWISCRWWKVVRKFGYGEDAFIKIQYENNVLTFFIC